MIECSGHKGYVKAAIEARVPLVPVVSIGAQQGQFYLSRSTWLTERLGLKRRLRLEILPISIGFPFGLSAIVPPNFPPPTKAVTLVLEPIDIVANFGDAPDVDAVDREVRSVMQAALDQLASQRRLPILG